MLKEELEGLNLSIIDEALIEDLGFTGNSVTATIGTKVGPVCAPLLEYEVTGNDSLVIDKESFNIQWNKIELKEDTVDVIRNGAPAVYKVVSKQSDASVKRRLP